MSSLYVGGSTMADGRIVNFWGETVSRVDKQTSDSTYETIQVSNIDELVSVPVTIEASYVRYRVRSLVFSSISLTIGLLDLYLFLSNDILLFHPYFGLILTIGGAFLLATTVLAIRGK